MQAVARVIAAERLLPGAHQVQRAVRRYPLVLRLVGAESDDAVEPEIPRQDSVCLAVGDVPRRPWTRTTERGPRVRRAGVRRARVGRACVGWTGVGPAAAAQVGTGIGPGWLFAAARTRQEQRARHCTYAPPRPSAHRRPLAPGRPRRIASDRPNLRSRAQQYAPGAASSIRRSEWATRCRVKEPGCLPGRSRSADAVAVPGRFDRAAPRSTSG